jgi:hypothetical protein
MAHIRMAGGAITASWADRRAIAWVSNFPAGCSIPKPPGGREGFHAGPRVPGRAKQRRRNLLITLPIGINEPFRQFIATIPEILWEASLGLYLTIKGFRPSPSSPRTRRCWFLSRRVLCENRPRGCLSPSSVTESSLALAVGGSLDQRTNSVE